MVSCLSSVHIWSSKNQTVIPDKETGVFTYYEKNDEGSSEQHYFKQKCVYAESRDVSWFLKNKRPDKIRDCLKEAEELMDQLKCIFCKWIDRETLLVVLSSGILIWLHLSDHTGDVDKIRIDKSLVGKLTGDNPSDVLFTDNYMVFCYPDKYQLDFVVFMKKTESEKKSEKLSSCDPKITQVDLVGPLNRKLERKLGCSPNEDIIMVWWPTAGYEAWPWSPMTSEKERSNLALYTVVGTRLELAAYTRTECDPVGIQYSSLNQDLLFSVEQSQSSAGDMQAHVCVYECSRNRITKQWTSRLPINSEVTCFGRNQTEDKVILGCYDGSLILYDRYLKTTRTSSVDFKPQFISWHPSGVLAFISSSKADIQAFDMALSPFNIQLVNERETGDKILPISKFFRSQPVVTHFCWNPLLNQDQDVLPECRDSLVMMCDRGPVILLQLYLGVLTQGQLSPLSLVKQYVKVHYADEAIKVVGALNWNLEGQTCYACVNLIANHLLRNQLNPKTEEQLEATLGLFYAPAKPLSELTVLEYRDVMSRLARRFFHQLLRHARFEKAFLLAVDIGARDLFMDIHYLAADKGELALAEVALRKAREVEAEGLGDADLYDENEDDLSAYKQDNADSDGSYSGSDEYYYQADQQQRSEVSTQRQTYPPYVSTQAAPPPPEFANPPLDTRFQQALITPIPSVQDYVGAAEVLLEERDSLLADSAPVEYTAALVGDDLILPPPPSHADENNTEAENNQSKSSKISVIHFGVV